MTASKATFPSATTTSASAAGSTSPQTGRWKWRVSHNPNQSYKGSIPLNEPDGSTSQQVPTTLTTNGWSGWVGGRGTMAVSNLVDVYAGAMVGYYTINQRFKSACRPTISRWWLTPPQMPPSTRQPRTESASVSRPAFQRRSTTDSGSASRSPTRPTRISTIPSSQPA